MLSLLVLPLLTAAPPNYVLETAEAPPTLAAAPFRFPVQYVARPTASILRGYAGRVEAGSIDVGDAVTVLPSGVTTQVREIRTFDGQQPRARLHDAVTLVLHEELDVSRGDMLVRADDAPAVIRTLEGTVCWLGETPLDTRRPYLFRHTTREVRARVDRIDHLWNVTTQEAEPAPAVLRMNDIGRVSLTLAQPVFADRYADNQATGSFILIDEATNGTVAAGLIQ